MGAWASGTTVGGAVYGKFGEGVQSEQGLSHAGEVFQVTASCRNLYLGQVADPQSLLPVGSFPPRQKWGDVRRGKPPFAFAIYSTNVERCCFLYKHTHTQSISEPFSDLQRSAVSLNNQLEICQGNYLE